MREIKELEKRLTDFYVNLGQFQYAINDLKNQIGRAKASLPELTKLEDEARLDALPVQVDAEIEPVREGDEE